MFCFVQVHNNEAISYKLCCLLKTVRDSGLAKAGSWFIAADQTLEILALTPSEDQRFLHALWGFDELIL